MAGNWKLNGDEQGNAALLKAVADGQKGRDAVEVLVCPAFVHIAQAARLLAGSPVAVGAQNVSEYEQGAYTGEVSGGMLRDLGCRYVIVGHSERRSSFRETNAQAARRFEMAHRSDLTPILCVGESLGQRLDGKAESVVKRQLRAVLRDAPRVDFVVAYEPVWAIGTGRAATPEQANEMHGFIRRVLAALFDHGVARCTRVVYGGSVTRDNAGALFSFDDVDGGLIGGASLDARAFNAICQSAHDAACTDAG